MMPMRANIVGPSCSAIRIRASIAACHSSASCSALGSLVMLIACVPEGDELAARAGAQLPNLSQALLQALKLQTNLRLHGVL
jgi:hypothetical protein